MKRPLPVGSLLQDGDEYFDRHQKKWFPTKCAGHRVGILNTTSSRYRGHRTKEKPCRS